MPAKSGTKMSYVTKILRPDEHLLVVGRLHWIIYKNAVLAVLVSIFTLHLARTYQDTNQTLAALMAVVCVVLLVAGAVIAIRTWFEQWTTEIAVTNRRVIYKRGFIRRHTAEMNMDKIESVTVTQSILGRMLDYGTIHVRGTGEGIERLSRIRAPIALRNCITAR
jgi:uncharacterized membrane protein YdbT with pleckstrin-like domain